MEDGEKAGADAQSEPNALVKVAIVAVVVALVGAALYSIYPQKLATEKNPSFVAEIFHSRAVIVMVRIAVLFAAVYVVASAVGLMAGRRWLTQLGPFRAAEPIAKLDDAAERLEEDLKDALGTIDDLSTSLEESDHALQKAHDDIASLLDYIDTLKAATEGDRP
jgi:septal ring factor EnvC (AmiA/AmiB activator)